MSGYKFQRVTDFLGGVASSIHSWLLHNRKFGHTATYFIYNNSKNLSEKQIYIPRGILVSRGNFLFRLIIKHLLHPNHMECHYRLLAKMPYQDF